MKRFLIILLSAIGGIPAFCQQADTTVLSFKEAVNVALKNNNNLAKENNEMIYNQVQKASRIASLAPTVEGNASVRRTDGNSFNQQEGRVINGKVDYVYGSIDAEVVIFNGFNRINAMRQANELVDYQAQRVKRSREDVIQQVASQYLQCLLDRELRDIDKANLKTQQEKLHQIEEQVKAGSVAEVDQYNQAYQVKSAELAVLRSNNKLNNDKVQLALLLQREPELPFVLQEPDWKLDQANSLKVEELYQVALDNRADLRSAESMEKASFLGYKARQGNYYPSIAAFYSYGSAYNYVYPSEGIPDPSNRTFEQQFTKDNTQSVYGLSMNIPIFRGLQTRSNVVRARIDYENAELDAKNTKLQVKSDVLLAYQNLNDALNTYLVSQSQLEAAEMSFELESERNRLGISDLVQYTQANQDYTRAQNDAAQSRYTLMFQNLLLDYALGTLTFESIP
ncbi:TolC family protein [Fulvivirga sediminis]|uniref:TolC family protein n=1 Tax=Fulvivirga sediminis TaxID=2803949 RepID=A0A937JXM4_9BACT|nr:TolC family protein [Fulvivirga sediminis]MBL3655613.1 TolC family protein [Fulvivirga sediminis]